MKRSVGDGHREARAADDVPRPLIRILSPRGKPWGVGVRLRGGLVATACHCLPRLPDARKPGLDYGEVRLQTWDGDRTVFGLLAFADPCSDLALVSGSTAEGDLDGDRLGEWEAFSLASGAARVSVTPLRPAAPVPVHLYTHEGTRLDGSAKGRFIQLADSTARVRGGTSGTPVFDSMRRVVGIVSTGNNEQADAMMHLVADCLPPWALRLAK